MLRAKTRWQLALYDDAICQTIADQCNLSPLVARLLVIRGIDTPERARNFLQISPEQFHDPFMLDGMEKCVYRIRRAIEQKEPICIYGDYDADGVSSTSLMIHLMRELGATFDYYIPNRFTEGYGLHKEALAELHEQGTKLVITVDTGISAVEQVEYGSQLGLDIIVTDHHEPPAIIPEAYAVINPKKPGCSYPFDMLAGVGVAFKLAHALLGQPPLHLIDLAAIGTIADLVPLVDENRLIASLGLKRLNQTRHIGLQALIRVCGLADTELSAGHVGFALGPRLNAGGRLETAEAAVKLLAATDTAEADQHARILDELNRERQELVQQMTEEAVAMVEAHYPPEQNRVLVLAKEGWNVGVVGIVASRIVEKFYRPTLVLGIDPEKGTAKGSARSIAGFDMYEALTACKELLPHYGGHTMAAGMTLPIENLEPLRIKLNELAGNWLTEDDLIPLTRVDLTVNVDEIDLDLLAQMEQLAPFGMGNPTPLVMVNDVEAAGIRTIGRDDSHLKCSLVKEGKAIDAIGFQWAHAAQAVTPKARLQVLGELSVNEWNGMRKPQLTIRDLAVPHRQVFDYRGARDKLQKWRQLAVQSDAWTVTFRTENYERLTAVSRELGVPVNILHCSEETGAAGATALGRTVVLFDLPRKRASLQSLSEKLEQAERVYCLFGDPDLELHRLSFPGRDQFKQLYQLFTRYPQIQTIHLDALSRKIQVKRDVLNGMLAVFEELGFVYRDADCYRLHIDPGKRPLEQSRLYTAWKEEAELATELLLSSHEELIGYIEKRAETAVL